MAHAATLNGLAGSLITAITGKQKDAASFAKLHEQTLKGLRDQRHARTNQFAIKDKLNGMVEKFEVLNRENLANALQDRLDELPPKSRWMPEILSFLLELSDRPAEKTCLEDVERSNGPVFAEKDLTWENILQEDPLSDSDIWENVERGYFSSGDDSLEDDTEPTLSTQATSLHDEDVAAVARLHLVQCDDSLPSATKESRESWKPAQSTTNSHILSELTIIREMLSMMHGLPTDLFHTDPSSGRVSLARRATMATASSHSLYDVLNVCVRSGTIINYLRRWVASQQDTPYLQSIQSCIHKLCVQFGRQLSQIEQRFIDPKVQTVVSAVQVQTEIHRAAGVLIRLATMVKNASVEKSPFALLNILYDEATTSQMMDSTTTFQTLSSVFLAGLRTYLRPVAAWTKTGSLSSKDLGDFFVIDSNHNCELGDFWHAHFSLHYQSNGTPNTPKCFKTFAPKIFALGKSRALLKRLNQEPDDISSEYPAPIPSFEKLSTHLQQNPFIPFPQLLHQTLQSWIAEISTNCAPQLQSALWYDHGLMNTLHALPYLYFSRDGIAFSTFADALIARVSNPSTTDQFLLTELAHTIFGSIPGVEGDNIYISTSPETSPVATTTPIRKLAELKLDYNLPWPVQNVTRTSSLALHNQALVFLLQVHYASTVIRGRFFSLRSVKAREENAISKLELKLRQHLLAFTNLLQEYLTTTASAIHSDMLHRMQRAEDIDTMAKIWENYKRRLEMSLLLAEGMKPVREAVLRVLELSEAHGGEGIEGLLEEYQRDMGFLVAGVRGVSRAGGEGGLVMLGERLENMGNVG